MTLSFVHSIRKITALMCFFLFLGILPLFAQKVTFEPVYYNITTEHGLPSMETYSVKQDSKGYIWICTDAGVCRYDGYEFRTFTTKDGLTDNVVFDTYEDHKGRIWFLTYNSMLCYWDGKKVEEYKYNNLILKYLNGEKSNIKSLYVSKNDFIYYNLNGKGLIEISDIGQHGRVPSNPKTVTAHHINDHVILSILYNMIPEEFLKVSIRDKDNEERIIDTVFNSIPHYRIASNNFMPSREYFYAYDNIYDIKHGRRVYSGSSIISLTIKDSLFWMGQIGAGVETGLIKNGKFHPLRTLLPNYSVTDILVDGFGGIWITTIEAGVFYMNDSNNEKISINNELTRSDVTSIFVEDKDVFVMSQKGLLNLNSGYKWDVLNWHRTEAEVPFMRILYQQSYSHTFSIANANSFYKRLFQDSGFKTTIFLGRSFYTVSGQYVQEKFEGYSQVSYPLSQRVLRGCQQGKRLYVIAGTYLYESSLNKLNEFHRVADVPKGAELTDVSPLLDDQLVIGTSNLGILIRNQDETIKIIDESKGLLSNKVTVVKTLKSGIILVGSPKGLTVLSSNGKVLKSITSNRIFGEISINAICVYDGWVYLGTKTGLLRIKESSLLKQHRPFNYDVLLKGVLFDGAYQKKTDAFTFPSDANLLQIDFSVLQFDNWFSKKYQYRIGKQGQWVDIESPSISLYRPTGEFDIEIRYMDANFRWSDPVRLCSVEVLVPFWMRWYFWTIIGIVLMLLSFILYERRRNQINQRLMRENQILQLEQQMLMQQQQMEHARMNPHFIFNVLNSIHSYILHEETDQAEKYLMMFSRLMREILVKAKEGTITVSDEWSVLEKYLELEQLRFKGRFRFGLSVNPADQHKIIPSMFVQPFVENAVLHGIAKTSEQDAEIQVHFETESNQCMRVTISNSGVISEEDRVRLEQSGDKNAFGITKKRLANYNTLLKSELFGIELTVVNDQKPATLIILRIPIL